MKLSVRFARRYPKRGDDARTNMTATVETQMVARDVCRTPLGSEMRFLRPGLTWLYRMLSGVPVH